MSSWNKAALVVSLAAVLTLSGCQAIVAYVYASWHGPEKAPAEYTLPAGKRILVLVEAHGGRETVKRFRSVFTPEWEDHTKTMGLTIHQVITLASIIEKETAVADERPIIASVFHNRLKRNMRLESDPTVIYGIEDYNGNITRKDLAHPTPYNTYTIKGLPPGPISNTGVRAIEATSVTIVIPSVSLTTRSPWLVAVRLLTVVSKSIGPMAVATNRSAAILPARSLI